MRSRPLFAGAASVALTLATSSPAAQAAPAPLEPAFEEAAGSELRGTFGWIIGGVALLIVALVVAGVILDNNTNAVPLSP